jgi:hypothetical protein
MLGMTMNRIIGTFGIVVALLISPAFARAQETVTIDMSVNNGAAARRGSGFLHGMSGSTPSNSLVGPMGSKFFRMDDNSAGNGVGESGISRALYSRIVGQGAVAMYILGDAWIDNVGGYNPTNARIVTSGTLAAWNSMVASQVKAAIAAGQTVQWDIWNEPNQYEFWTGTEAEYQAAWQSAVNTIRGISASQKIVGPSTDGLYYLTDLLAFATANNVLPDIVDWHELSGIPSEISDIAQVKAYLAANNPSLTTLDISEMNGYGETYLPGTNIQYIATVERQGINAAAHACWNSDCFDYSLDGLLGTDGTTVHANWYAYQAYAAITGTLVGVTPSATVDGVAGNDPMAGQAYSVFGRIGGSGDVVFNFINVGSAGYLNASNKVHAKVYTIANDGGAGSAGATLLSDSNVTISGNSISITVPNMGSDDVAVIQLIGISQGGGPPPAPTGLAATAK